VIFAMKIVEGIKRAASKKRYNINMWIDYRKRRV